MPNKKEKLTKKDHRQLSDDPDTNYGLGFVDKAERTCLKCGKTFLSKGKGNRRCPSCSRAINKHPIRLPIMFKDTSTDAGVFTPYAR